MHGGKIGFLQKEQKKSTKGTKNEQKKRLQNKNTTAVHAQHVCRQHATPPTKLRERCQRRHTDAHKSRYKKAKSSNKNLHFNALHLFCRTQKPRSFPLSPLFHTLSLHADTTHSCVANAQASVCVCMYVCLPP